MKRVELTSLTAVELGKKIKSKEVTVLDESEEALEIVKKRYPDTKNIVCVHGTLKEQESESYDYVILAGSLEAAYEEQISEAKRVLKQGGVLITAACNKLGMKYWAGS